MEDIAVIPILSEIFYTFPEWDVPELKVERGKVQYFRDGYQIVQLKDDVATRFHAEFVRPRRYEPSITPGPYEPPVTKLPLPEIPPAKPLTFEERMASKKKIDEMMKKYTDKYFKHALDEWAKKRQGEAAKRMTDPTETFNKDTPIGGHSFLAGPYTAPPASPRGENHH